MADEICITTTSGESRILVGAGLLAEIGALVVATWPRARVARVIADAAVAPLQGPFVANALSAAGLTVHTRSVPTGEASKSLAAASELYDWLLGGGVARDDIVIALGGGMVGDLVGFVAATCLRGLALVQVPTTLLAMVDSSVGGKTGVNHATGKNLIGAFYQPPLVVVDPTLLTTLPARELTSGWGEVIKYGLIECSIPGHASAEPVLLPWLEAEAAALMALDPARTSAVVRHCIDLKASVVRVDPLEQGPRAILNYGHTIGHALEAVAGYGGLRHGEAVAIGMRAAAKLGCLTGHCQPTLLERQQALIRRFGLPERAPEQTPAELWPYIRRDKKAISGTLRWIIPTTPGRVEIVRGIDEDQVERVLTTIVD